PWGATPWGATPWGATPWVEGARGNASGQGNARDSGDRGSGGPGLRSNTFDMQGVAAMTKRLLPLLLLGLSVFLLGLPSTRAGKTAAGVGKKVADFSLPDARTQQP